MVQCCIAPIFNEDLGKVSQRKVSFSRHQRPYLIAVNMPNFAVPRILEMPKLAVIFWKIAAISRIIFEKFSQIQG